MNAIKYTVVIAVTFIYVLVFIYVFAGHSGDRFSANCSCS